MEIPHHYYGTYGIPTSTKSLPPPTIITRNHLAPSKVKHSRHLLWHHSLIILIEKHPHFLHIFSIPARLAIHTFSYLRTIVPPHKLPIVPHDDSFSRT
jgi:hypothetical protein